MRWMRSTWGSRWLAGLLVCCLLPMLVLPTARLAQGAVYASYADWLRTQLSLPADAAFEDALAAATATEPASLDAFLTAFVAAYQAGHPGAVPAEAFTTLDLSNEALVTYLQQRFLRITGAATLPRVVLMQALAAKNKGLDRVVQAVRPAARALTALPAPAFLDAADGAPSFVRAFRLLSAARPLGP